MKRTWIWPGPWVIAVIAFPLNVSRIEPEEGAWSEQAVQHYAAVIAAIRARGMEPRGHAAALYVAGVVCLRAADGSRPDSARLFARYVTRLLDELKQPVKFWLTINEPTVYVLQAYIQRRLAAAAAPGAGSRLVGSC